MRVTKLNRFTFAEPSAAAMSTEHIYLLGMMQIGLVLVAAFFRIKPDASQGPALQVLKLTLLCDAASWLFYWYPEHSILLSISAFFAAANNWLVLCFAALRCQRRAPWQLAVGMTLLQALLYTSFTLQQHADYAMHTITVFVVLSIGPTIWLFWTQKAVRTVSDQWFCGVLAFWLSICLSRSLLLLWQPAWLLSSSLISQVVWPGVLVAYGLFAMTSYLEEIQQKLKIESLTDPLTGLLNRRGMLEMATGCLAYLQRHQQPGALLMIDLDHFKNINDQLGHATGDLVLQHVATAFKQELRQSDMLARVGGEEFLIFLPMVDGKVAAVTAERLLKCVTNLQLPELEIIQQRLTISIGVSLFGPEYDFLQQQQQADLALYRAKHFGRNRIEFATD